MKINLSDNKKEEVSDSANSNFTQLQAIKMKQILRSSISVIVFFSLVIFTIAVTEPLYRHARETISSLEGKVVNMLEEKTGLSVTYESLSPSVLSKFYLKGVTFFDSETKEEFVHIKKISLSYSIKKGISGLVINGVEIQFNMLKNADIVEKIKRLNPSEEKVKKETAGDRKESEKSEKIENAENVKKSATEEIEKTGNEIFNAIKGISGIKLPFDVVLKNISIIYGDRSIEERLFISKIILDQYENYNYLDVTLIGTIRHKNLDVAEGEVPFTMGCRYNLYARILPDINGSHVKVSLSNLSGVDLTFNGIDFLVSYSEPNLVIQSVKSIHPFELMMNVDLEKSKADGKLKTNKYEPLKMFRLSNPNSQGRFFEKLQVNFDADVTVDYSNLDSIKYNYNAKTSASLPKQKKWCEFYGVLDCYGDEKEIVITDGFIESEMVGGTIVARADMPKGGDMSKIQPQGTIYLDHWFIPHRKEAVSAEIYVDPTENGFMCFAPQVMLGEKLSYTALQIMFSKGNDSFDFILDLDDYSHPEYENPGHINLDGSFMFGHQSYMQMQCRISDFFIDSALNLIGFCIPDEEFAENFTEIAPKFQNYISTDEFYFSTDYDSLNYNAPYCLAADTKDQRNLLVLSVDGSGDVFNISDLTLLYADQSMSGNGMIDFSDNSKAQTKLFSADFSINSIPYYLNGSYSSGILTATGNYGFDSSFTFGKDGSVEGFLNCASMPLKIGNYAVTTTIDTNLLYMNRDFFTLSIENLSLEEPTGNFALNPSFRMKGIANQYGIVMDQVNYTDSASVLDGTGSLLWNISREIGTNGKEKLIFDSVHFNFDLMSPVRNQKVAANCDLTNPVRVELGDKNWMDSIYVNSDAVVTQFPIGAFITDQTTDNTLSGTLTVAGTLAHPVVSSTIENISLTWWGLPFVASGNVIYDESGLSFSSCNASWYSLTVKDGRAVFSLSDYNGKASAVLGGDLWGYSLDAPFEFELSNLSKKPFDIYTMVFNFPKITGTLFKRESPFTLTMLRNEGRFDFYTNDDGGITASIEDGGLITARTGKKSPFDMAVDGIIGNNFMDLTVSNVVIDMGNLSSFMRLPMINFNSGKLTGQLRAVGLPNDPELSGNFEITKFSMEWPGYIAQPLEASKVEIDIGNGQINVPGLTFSCGKGKVEFDAKFFLDRWRIGDSEMNVKSVGKQLLPLKLKLPFVNYTGGSKIDAQIRYGGDSGLDFDGNIFLQDGDFDLLISGFLNSGDDAAESSPDDLVFRFRGKIDFGTHLQFYVNPLLRGVVVPDNVLNVTFDSGNGDFSLKGDLKFRGGDIAWLNRNFYMREGGIAFNETAGSVDPRVTVRAEARERDSDGNPVRIILSATNQPFSSFNPSFSASPPKSEREIMEIMGQIVSADSQSMGSFLVAGGDYLVQTTLIRKIEDTLRKLCNFDIFSVRTMVLQNAVKQGLNLNKSTKQLTFSNFFDNSTVYVGKYFGSSVYVDALLHWSYDENLSKASGGDSVAGLVFQPEIGFELTSPYVNIRCAVAPDFEAMKNHLWVPSTSITLSWKFNF